MKRCRLPGLHPKGRGQIVGIDESSSSACGLFDSLPEPALESPSVWQHLLPSRPLITRHLTLINLSLDRSVLDRLVPRRAKGPEVCVSCRDGGCRWCRPREGFSCSCRGRGRSQRQQSDATPAQPSARHSRALLLLRWIIWIPLDVHLLVQGVWAEGQCRDLTFELTDRNTSLASSAPETIALSQRPKTNNHNTEIRSGRTRSVTFLFSGSEMSFLVSDFCFRLMYLPPCSSMKGGLQHMIPASTEATFSPPFDLPLPRSDP